MTTPTQGLTSISEAAVAGLQTTLRIVKDVSSNFGIPGLQAGLTGLEIIIEMSQELLENDERIPRLLERIMNLDVMLQSCRSGAKLPHPIYTRIAKIVRLWETEAAKVSELRDRNGALRWLTAKRDAATIQACLDTINQSIQDFLLESAFNTEIGIHRLQHDLDELTKLARRNMNLLQANDGETSSPTVTTLKLLQPHDPVFLEVQSWFNDRWISPQVKRPKIKAIYQISTWSKRGIDHLQQFSKYRSSLRKTMPDNRIIEESLFHTHRIARSCTLGDDLSATITPCFKPKCSVCHILRCHFKDELIRATGTPHWGHGFYFSTASNKANFFYRNQNVKSPNRVILLSKVLVGIRKLMYAKDPTLTGPPKGTHSIKAATKDKGGLVKFSERVVYRADAICPWVMILY